MKILLCIFTLLLSTSVFAHEDHALGQGTFHALYHLAFWAILAVVLYKGVKWLKAKKQPND